MKLVEKVKAQAAQAAEKAQEGLRTGQARIEEAQTRKKADALLRDLGALAYAERTGRATEATAAEAERLVAELQAEGYDHTAATAPAGASGATGENTTPQAGGDFTLDGL
jgi:hypothetical protein